MKEIDITKWKRREHFEFFRKVDLPFYNVNVIVDISGLREYSRIHSFSISNLLIYLTTKSMNKIENFKYRLRGDNIIIHEILNPCFAHIKNGDDLFSLIVVDFSKDVFKFDQTVRIAIEQCNSYFNLEKLIGRDDYVFISPMPWISFTGIDHTMSLKRDDGIPRVTWGKYYDDNGRIKLPFNIQVNHMFVDGIHVGRFFEELDQEIQEIRLIKIV